MRLIAPIDIREPDLAHIEAPFFACSKIRRLLLDRSRLQEIFGISNFAQPFAGLDYQRRDEKLLHEIEEGSCFLVIRFGASPFRPAARWQPAESIVGVDRWIADESLQPCARFKLEQAIARIEREKQRSHSHASPTRETSRIVPISGTAEAGIWKRYANFATGDHAFPKHLTAADEKDIGSKLRSLYGGNDTIQNQADIAAYDNKQSILGVTHGQIFDAVENVVTVAGFLEGGLALSRLKDVGKVAERVSSRLHNKAGIEVRVTSDADRAAAGPVNFMGETDNFYKFSSRRADIDPGGHFDVVAHGSPDVIEFMTTKGPMIVDHRTAARLIQKAPGYNSQPIRLLSCETGACDVGFAQNLANKLNVPVQAPTELVWAQNNGRIFVAPRLSLNPRSTEFYKPDLANPGTFRTFIPGGNK